MIFEVFVFFGVIILILSLFFFSYLKYENQEWWKTWNNMPRNFPFKYKGKILWYSRSCAVAAFVFGKDEHNQWCILANQRGTGAPDYNGLWNCICGYVVFNSTGEENAVREIEEETGIAIPAHILRFVEVNDDPNESNKQNITLRYFANIEHITKFGTPKITNLGEEDEVADVKWIPVKEIDQYAWAFGHKKIIKSYYKQFIIGI